MIKPHDYQKQAVEFFKRMKKVYFAMGMGLGKTLTSLWGATEVSKKKVLLVAELNEIANSQNFKKEVDGNIEGWEYVSLRKKKDPLSGDFDHKVCGINPEMLLKLPIDEVLAKFDVIIIDEATLAKETTTDKFKGVFEICKRIEYVILLSGTPLMNGASELYAPLCLLSHRLSGGGRVIDRWAFEDIFAGAFQRKVRNTGIHWKDYIRTATETKNIRELRYLIQDQFFFLRKEDTKGIFKHKERMVEYIEMTPEWEDEYSLAWENYQVELRARLGDIDKKKLDKKLENVSELKKLIENSRIAQINSKYKAQAFIKHINEGKYNGDTVLVYCHFQETEKILLEQDGAVSYEDYTENRKPCKYIVAKIGKHAKGGNLPEIHITAFIDMSFVPNLNLQAENRMDRPEQTQDMRVIYYLTKDERVDTRIRVINQKKMKAVEEFMRPLCEEELLVMPEKVSALKAKYYKQFNLLGV